MNRILLKDEYIVWYSNIEMSNCHLISWAGIDLVILKCHKIWIWYPCRLDLSDPTGCPKRSMFALSVFFEWLLYVCFLVLFFWYHEWLEFVEEQSNTRQIAIVKEVDNSHTVASEYTYCRWIWTIYCHTYLGFRLPCKIENHNKTSTHSIPVNFALESKSPYILCSPDGSWTSHKTLMSLESGVGIKSVCPS